MCKQSKKRLFVFLIISVLVLGHLAAWPSWLTGPAPNKEVVEKVVEKVIRIPADSQETLEQIESMRQLTKQLEEQLTSAKNLHLESQNLISNLEIQIREQEKLINEQEIHLKVSEQKILNLEANLEQQNLLLSASEESSKALKKDYDKLLSVKKPASWKGLVGASVLYAPELNNQLGVGLDIGVGYNRWALLMGVVYKPKVWDFKEFQSSDLEYKAGLQFTF